LVPFGCNFQWKSRTGEYLAAAGVAGHARAVSLISSDSESIITQTGKCRSRIMFSAVDFKGWFSSPGRAIPRPGRFRRFPRRY
jgi:hypothetical protein